MAVSPLSAGIAVNRHIPCYYRPPAAPAQEKAASRGRFFRRGPARYRNFRVYNLSPMRYNVRVCLGLLSKQRQTAPPPISAGMMELVDMRDLGSRASPRWGSSPHARTTSPRTTYRSRRLFYKSHLSLILSRLLSKPDPLSLGSGLGPPLRGGFVCP